MDLQKLTALTDKLHSAGIAIRKACLHSDPNRGSLNSASKIEVVFEGIKNKLDTLESSGAIHDQNCFTVFFESIENSRDGISEEFRKDYYRNKKDDDKVKGVDDSWLDSLLIDFFFSIIPISAAATISYALFEGFSILGMAETLLDVIILIFLSTDPISATATLCYDLLEDFGILGMAGTLLIYHLGSYYLRFWRREKKREIYHQYLWSLLFFVVNGGLFGYACSKKYTRLISVCSTLTVFPYCCVLIRCCLNKKQKEDDDRLIILKREKTDYLELWKDLKTETVRLEKLVKSLDDKRRILAALRGIEVCPLSSF